MTAAKKQKNIVMPHDLASKRLRDGVDWAKVSISEEADVVSSINLALDGDVEHICHLGHPFLSEGVNSAALLLKNSSAISSYPLSTALRPEDAGALTEQALCLYEAKFVESDQKTQLMDDLQAVLLKKNVIPTIASDVLNIADELFTNAVYNAPFVDFENNSVGIQRHGANIRMHPGKEGRLILGADESRIVIGCRDTYGTLNLIKLFTRIKSCYEKGVAANINMSRGGAGIGSYMVFHAAMSYFAVVDQGLQTTICCTLPLKMSGRTRAELPKNLHFVFKK